MQVACLHPGPTNIDPHPHVRINSVMAGLFKAIKKPAGFDLTSWIFTPDRPLSLQEIWMSQRLIQIIVSFRTQHGWARRYVKF